MRAVLMFLAVVVVVVAVVVLVVRAASAPGSGAAGRSRSPRGARRVGRPVAPDDDPEFLRELQRRTRRDDAGS